MTNEDHKYINLLLEKNLIKSSCLEVGSAEDWCSLVPKFNNQGIKTIGTDLSKGKYVDHIIDFEADIKDIIPILQDETPFQTILCLNVLEHTFNPIQILDNLIQLLNSGGKLILIAPAAWPLHGYPIDCWRLMPDFYTKYAELRNLTIDQNLFRYLGFGPVDSYKKPHSSGFPLPLRKGLYFYYSKLIHKIFNTNGRNHLFSNHIAIGLVMTKN